MRTSQYLAHRGITLLVTLLLMSVLLGVSASLITVSVSQFKISNISRSSEMAFQAASTGVDCIAFFDRNFDDPNSFFKVKGDGTPVPEEIGVKCMNVTSDDVSNDDNVQSGDEQRFRFSWGTPEVCTDVSIYKFYDTDSGSTPDADKNGDDMKDALRKTLSTYCPEQVECTVIRSRGYSVPCDDIDNANVLERELVERY
jgi:hypothetical protein